MSFPFIKNFLGLHQTDFEMLKIPHPRLELTLHITAKTMQAGVLLGSLFIGPAVQAVKGPRDMQSMREAAVHGGTRGAQVGAVLGPVLTYLTMRNQKEAAIYDRSYRLRFNSGQLRVDRFCAIAAILGSSLCGAEGAVFGIDLSIFGAAFITNVFKK